MTEYLSHDWLQKVLRQREAPADGLTKVMHCELAQKGQLLHYTQDIPRFPGSFVSVYDGELSVTHRPGAARYDISRDSGKTVRCPDPRYYNGESRLRQSLDDWAGGKGRIRTIQAREEKAGTPGATVQIEIAYNNGWSNKVAVVPDKGYAVERLAVYDSARHMVEETNTSAFKELSNDWYPEKIAEVHYFASGGVAKRDLYDVTDVTVRPGDIPDDLFKVKIPKDAEIYDQDTKQIIRDPAIAQEYLDNARSYVTGQGGRPYRYLVWALPLAVGACCLLAAIWAFRRRRSAG